MGLLFRNRHFKTVLLIHATLHRNKSSANKEYREIELRIIKDIFKMKNHIITYNHFPFILICFNLFMLPRKHHTILFISLFSLNMCISVNYSCMYKISELKCWSDARTEQSFVKKKKKNCLVLLSVNFLWKAMLFFFFFFQCIHYSAY